VIEEIIDRDETYNLLPFVRTTGKAYVYNRENTISEGTFLDVSGTVQEGAATFTEVITKLRILAGDVDVDKFLNETMDDTNDQLATQISLKAKALGRKFQKTFVAGDATGTPLEFDGLVNLVEAGQTINADTNGAALTLGMLDALVDKVPNGPDALVMNPAVRRQFVNLLRTVGGGTDAAMMQLRNFSRPILTHNGIPVLINDFLPVDETLGTGTALSSVYAVRMNELDGLHGLYGGDSAGIRLEQIGTVQNKDAWRYRVKWYVGLALKSTKSLARLQGVTTT
jgi:HK97 family phage major capsid protein